MLSSTHLNLKKRPEHSAWLALLTVTSLSFLFLIAFPFGHHNESYGWMVFYENMNFYRSIAEGFPPVHTYRPLGNGTAWILYDLTHNIYAQQLFNWFFACAAWLVLWDCVRNKIAFAFFAFVSTFGFFAGYIYLFHLHGVFYGPLQLYVSIIFCFASQNKLLSGKKILLLGIAGVAAAMYHTFGFLVFLAFAAGYFLQNVKRLHASWLAPLIAMVIINALGMYLILKSAGGVHHTNKIAGFLTSYTTNELNMPLRLLSAFFTLLVVYSFNITKAYKFIALVLALLLSLLFIYFKLPVLLLWVAACIAANALDGKWAMAAIISATAIFPAGTFTGTPTYVLYVIMLCTFVTAERWVMPLFTKNFSLIAAAIVVCFTLLFFIISNGYHVPVLSKLINPILSEKEKTFQMENIFRWKEKAMAYRSYKLIFTDEAEKPAGSKNVTTRLSRPPTQQRYVDRYAVVFLPGYNNQSPQSLFITFGNKILPQHKMVYEVKGHYNGNAYVWLAQ